MSVWHEILSPSDIVSIGSWQHIAVARRGTNYFHYRNGALVSGPIPRTSAQSGSGAFLIGASGIGNSQFFDGKVDELKIYARALTDAEIRAIYNATK